MPKKVTKSIGRKFKGKAKEVMPSGPQIGISQSSELPNQVVESSSSVDVPMDISLETNALGRNAEMSVPGCSGLQQPCINPESGEVNKPEPETNRRKSFEEKLLCISKMERRTARAFKERGIEEEFEWPAVREDRNDSLMRKFRNEGRLNAARQRQFQNPADEELSFARHQARAEHCRRQRNSQDEMLSQQRLESHIKHCRKYRNPEDEILSQQCHQADAEH